MALLTGQPFARFLAERMIWVTTNRPAPPTTSPPKPPTVSRCPTGSDGPSTAAPKPWPPGETTIRHGAVKPTTGPSIGN